MNIKQLKEIIKDLPDNMECYQSSDDEGNSYRKLEGLRLGFVRKDEIDDYSPEDIYGTTEDLEYYEIDFDEVIKVVVF